MLPGVGVTAVGTKIALAWSLAGAPEVAADRADPAGPPTADDEARGARGSIEATPSPESTSPVDDPSPSSPPPSPSSPPRVAGAYVGGMLTMSLTVPRLDSFDQTSTGQGGGGAAETNAIGGVTMSVDAGTVVLPWMSIGFSILGGGGSSRVSRGRRLSHGGLLVDLAFFPKPTLPLSLRAGFGAGFGSVRELEGNPDTGAPPKTESFGGAMFRLGARYAFFPNAKRRRPRRAGGWAIAPELSWLTHPPAQRGSAMANTIILGLWSGFFFGN